MAGSTTNIDASAGGRGEAHKLKAEQSGCGSEEAEPGGRLRGDGDGSDGVGGVDGVDGGSEVNEGGGLVVTLMLETADTQPAMSHWLEAKLRAVAERAGAGKGQLTVVVVDAARMAALHERHCRVAGSTDVLTFDMRDEPDGAPVEADVVVCLDEAARQARLRGHTVREEVLLYAVHGLLHLLGEDDHDEAGFLRMHEREDALLKAVGVRAVFGTTERSAERPDEVDG